MYNGVRGKAPETLEFFRIFVLKVTLQFVRLLLTASYRRNGEQDVLVAPPVILLEEQLLPCSPGSRAYGGTAERCGSDTAAARYVASRHGMVENAHQHQLTRSLCRVQS